MSVKEEKDGRKRPQNDRVKDVCTPAIIWHSDPVNPDETTVLMGDGFTPETVVELARLAEDQPGQPGEVELSVKEWTKISPLQQSAAGLKFVIPAAWQQGIFAGRVITGGQASKVFFLNAPDLWWMQGDGDTQVTPGGWLRIFGKCLDFGGRSQVAFCWEKSGEIEILKPEEADCYSISLSLPQTLAPGAYRVWVHNGLGGNASWKESGKLRVLNIKPVKETVLNVLDFGARPNTEEDCTPKIISALERLGGVGGGVLFFPRGRYRIDSRMRSGLLSIDSSLKIPPGVTLRGEGMGLVSLWWPDRKEPLPTLIEGGDNFGIEDLTIYTQGPHRNIITGSNNVRICRVRIRANRNYMCIPGGGEFHGRVGIWDDDMCAAAAIELWGDNVQVTDCDIYCSNFGFFLKHVRGGLIANNTVRYGGTYMINEGGERIIFERNNCAGVELSASGGGVAVYFGASACRHVYFAHNTLQHIYGGDREAMTFDGHGTAYLGKIKKVQEQTLVLAEDPFWGAKHKDMISDWHGTRIFILDGKGVGQCRVITGCEGRNLTVDHPWDILPDASSVFSIGKFNGRHLFIGNTVMDAGSTIQLYPPNFECIVAENRGYRAGNFNSGGMLTSKMPWGGKRVEPSWYNQFLDNTIEEGNGWGGGESVVNGWIGGEAVMNIYGVNTETDYRFPISRCQILRRNVLKNNSSMRITGAVDNLLVEKCWFGNNEYGIVITRSESERDAGMALAGSEKSVPSMNPSNVMLRNNCFENIPVPFTGNSVNEVCIRSSSRENNPQDIQPKWKK